MTNPSGRPSSESAGWYTDHRRTVGIAVVAVALLLLVVALAIGASLVRPSGLETPSSTPDNEGTHHPDPSGSTDASTPSPTAAPSGDPDAPEPSETPVATPPALDPITGWRFTQSFDSSPATAYATDLVAWDRGFVAVGSAWESAFHVTSELPALWTSPDGVSWEKQQIDLGVDDVTLVGVARRADGRLLLVGRTPGEATGSVSSARSMAWVSADAAMWEEIEFPAGGNADVSSFDHGLRGYALTAGGEVWFSADGIDWTMTYEGADQVVAGHDGFVAVRTSGGSGTGSVVASADGQEWFEAQPTASRLGPVAAMGGDWVALGGSIDPHTITAWHSANGLDWVETLDVNDLTGPDGPKTGRGLNELATNGADLAGGAGYALLTLTNNHCCAQMSWNYGVWASSDGITWVPAVEGDAFVSSVATAGTVTVAAGHLGRGSQPAFWIADR